MNILVTGATGFLGKRLSIILNQAGYNVTAIGRNKQIGLDLKSYGINFTQLDITNNEEIKGICKNKDIIIHSAALSSPWGKYKDFYNTNVNGTKNLLDGALKYNVLKFIHISTPSIYFEFKDKYNISESDPLPKYQINHYANTKLLAEYEVDKAFNLGLNTITLRPRAIFGPGDTSIIPRLIKANTYGKVPIIGNKKVLIDITYIDNVVDAIILAINAKDNVIGKKYNITNGESVDLYELLEKVILKLNMTFNSKNISFNTAYTIASFLEFTHKYLLFNKEPILTKYTVGLLSTSQTLDIIEAKKDLGYKPKITIEEGINLFTKWWDQQQ